MTLFSLIPGKLNLQATSLLPIEHCSEEKWWFLVYYFFFLGDPAALHWPIASRVVPCEIIRRTIRHPAPNMNRRLISFLISLWSATVFNKRFQTNQCDCIWGKRVSELDLIRSSFRHISAREGADPFGRSSSRNERSFARLNKSFRRASPRFFVVIEVIRH